MKDRDLNGRNKNMKINLKVAAFVAMLISSLSFTAQAQVAPGSLVPLGGYLQDGAGNLYQVVLAPVPKTTAAPAVAPAAAPVVAAPVVAAPVVAAPVMAAPVVAQPAQQGNGLGRYVGDVLVTGAGGAATGAILGGITGRDVGKEALGMAGGQAGGKVATDLINGIFRR